MEKNSIFLSMEQVVAAVLTDLRQYDPQILLLCELIRLLSDGRAIVKREPGENGAWIRIDTSTRMSWMDGEQLVEHACGMLAGAEPTPELLASVCGRVFQARAFPDRDPETGRPGVRIETGMEDFKCRQCGRCCRKLDYHDALTAGDVAGLRDMGREDVLRWVGVSAGKDNEPVYRIWVQPGTRQVADPCPFLKRESSENRWICRIHDVKPAICRQYPLSRKHALMTGCPGFRREQGSVD